MWTYEFDKRDSRELLALSLREKRVKWGENSDSGGPMGNREGDSFLDVLVTLRKSKKRLGGACSLHGRPSLGLWGLRG